MKEKKNTKKVDSKHVNCVDDCCGLFIFQSKHRLYFSKGVKTGASEAPVPISQAVAEPFCPICQQDLSFYNISVGWELLRSLAN